MYNPADVRWPVLISTMSQYYQRYYRIFGLNALHFKLTPAVGKFHLGAHIKECFYKYSLNFIEGSGQIDGEIMETLWFIMDKVSGMTRSMSWAHRQEMLDDYMEDGNFKKLVRSGKFSHRLTPVNALTITQWTHW